jgi:cob(I)alamin adenosyltransferase
MPIYTKTGDKGQTSIFGGKRVPKYDPQVEAYGGIDEATCFIGWALEEIHDEVVRTTLTDVQYNLYKIMAYLAGAELKEKAQIVEFISLLEKEIDQFEKTLPKLTRFILPQGSEATSRLHISRSMIRSAERRVIYFVSQKEESCDEDEIIVKFLNRLSDWFFMVARKYSQDEKVT